MLRTIIGVLLLAGLAAGAYVLARPAQQEEIRATISAAEALGGDGAAGFAQATAARSFSFPADHGPHPEFRNEWWYYTGNLESGEGRHFGFELTIFRVALSPELAERDSDWATNQLYFAHFALTDVGGERFYFYERASRGAQGLAGAQATPFKVWIEDWSVVGQGDQALPMRLTAEAADVGIELSLDSAKPIVLQGDRGLSQKGPEHGNASFYYSLTRMPTTGTVRVGNQSYQVSGLSWMDREWGTSALGEALVGWDWFALQLADGRDLMYYQLRRRDGGIDPYSGGTLVLSDGSSRPLQAEEVELQVLDHWQSPRGGQYPAGWRLRVPSESIDLEIRPYLADQELQVSTPYWEGAVEVREAGGSTPLGSGYVELVGYADRPEAP